MIIWISGLAQERAPGSVNQGEKFAFFLHAAGIKTFIFHLIFTYPGTFAEGLKPIPVSK